ncbi:MAG: hypothetical protein IH626_01740 [Rhodospirillales bacterium]|nr:hypothetical protein [Rhodospirillales bacterium]
MADRPYLPGILAQVADEIGEAKALEFAHKLGGTEIHLKATFTEDDKLVRAMGMETARRIVNALGPGPLLVPMAAGMRRARRNARIAELRARGETIATLALGAGVHERTVYRVQRRARRRLPLLDRDD